MKTFATGLLLITLPLQPTQTAESPAAVAQAASVRADVVLTSNALQEMAFLYDEAPAAVHKNLARVSADRKSDRLAMYFVEKARTGKDRLDKDDLADFSWTFATADLRFVTLTVATDAEMRVSAVRTGDFGMAYVTEGLLKNGDAFVVPIQGPTVDVSGRTSSGRVIVWTGHQLDTSGKAVVAHFRAASSAKGCEIFVNSEPPGASVFFNGRPYYEVTNTSSVRDAGLWTVRVAKEGFRDWQGTRTLSPGASWTIDARLSPQQ